MKFIELKVRTARIVHGFDSDNREIVEEVKELDFTRKLIAVQRIQSVSEAYILVTGSHGRVMYWEYELSLADINLNSAVESTASA